MFLEMQILALEGRFAFSRAANVFSKVEKDHGCFQRQEHQYKIIAKACMKRDGIYVIWERSHSLMEL